MIRLTFLIRRRPDTDPDAFRRYWRDEHGALVASLAPTLGIRRYVQSHTLDDALGEAMRRARGGMEPPYDGVADVWWDHEDTLTAAAGTDAGQRAGAALLEDEAKFIDLPRSPMWLAHEYPQVNPTPENVLARPGSGLVKLVFPLRMRADVGLEGGQGYWHTRHGPLIRSQAAGSGIIRYVQVHRYGSALEPGFRASRGVEVAAYDGHAELWFDRAALGTGSPGRTAAAARAAEDEARFLDFDRSSIWLAEEHPIVDRPDFG